ncbi:MAG: HAD-IA family hydrolase [Terriglobales bacterium]
MIRFLRRFDARSIRLLIFDLDGTLIDSRLDLIHSVNAMLRHFERPELDGDVIASYVGDGAPALVRRALAGRDGEAGGNGESGEGEALFRSALEYFLGYYRLHKLDHTTVYDGIPETLAALAAGADKRVPPYHANAGCGGDPGVPDTTPTANATAKAADGGVRTTRVMAVLSNKPVRPSQDIVQALGLGDYFVRIYGGNSFATKKPDPLGAQTLLQETGVAAEEALMIGDSSIDVLTGRNAGLWTCGVTYGFAPHSLKEVAPDVVVDGPRELGDMLG